MTKLEKIEIDMQKAREKIAEWQNRLRQLDGQRIEQENLQIVQHFRALRMTPNELIAFINSGALPASISGSSAGADMPVNETIYTRRKTGGSTPDSLTGHSRIAPDSLTEHSGIEPDNLTGHSVIAPDNLTGRDEAVTGGFDYSGENIDYESEDMSDEES